MRFFTPQAGATAEYTLYTRSGRRAYRQIGSQQTDFLELGGQTLVQLTKVGATTTPVYLHPDLLGSPRKASSGTGALLWQEHYDPYGAKLNGSETTVGYTGHAHDATGLTYMKARFYDPSQHRFLTPDPIHFVDDNPFTFNRYAYGNNNPYRFSDPTGREAACVSNSNCTEMRAPTPKETAVMAGVAAGAVVLTFTKNPSQALTAGRAVEKAVEGALTKTAESARIATKSELPASTPVGSQRSPMDVPKGTNSAENIAGRSYSGHSLDRMQGRGQTPSVVENTIATGEATPGNQPGTTVFRDPVNGTTAVTDTVSGRVITVY